MVVGPAVGDDDEVGRSTDDIEPAGDESRAASVFLAERPAAGRIIAGVTGGASGRVAGTLEDSGDGPASCVEIARPHMRTAFVEVGAARGLHEALIPGPPVRKQGDRLLVFDRVLLDIETDLLLVVDAAGFLRGFARGAERGQEDCGQDRDDGNDDQEFDECERTMCGTFDSHCSGRAFIY